MENSAIHCEGVRINFTKPILDSLDLKIPYGSIYGLVGASGCGKTTLIRCIWGYYKPSCGIVRTLGYEPDASSSTSLIPGPAIGYMPQDVSLDLCLTAKETLIYFGKCYNILGEELEEKLGKFRKVLKIKNLSQKVDYLSSGQRRRLSFVCSVIHEPSLLLLDEPTVGSDPLTREFMWKYIFQQRDQQGVTVLVTTHYIDELIHSDSIGILRDGKIQLEVDPSVVRSQFRNKSLSSIITEMIVRHGKNSENWTNDNICPQNIPSSTQTCSIRKVSKLSEVNNHAKVAYFFPFIYRQWKLTQRLIILPALLLIITHGVSVISLFLIYGVFDSNTLKFASIDPGNQSKILFNMSPIDKIPRIALANEIEGIKSVELKMNTGYILFAEDFDIRMREWVECLFKNHPSYTGKHVGIARYRGDYSNRIIADYVEWILDESFRNIALNLSQSIYGDPGLIDFIKIDAIIESPGSDEFFSKAYHEVIWRLVIHVSFTGSLFLLGILIVSDKKSFVVERQLAIGYRKNQIIFYYLVWNIVAALIVSYLNYFTTIPLVQPVNRKGSNIFPLIVVTILTNVSVLATHILVEFYPSIAIVLSANLFLVISGFSIGRIAWPQESFPYYADYFSNVLPSPAGADAVLATVVQGMDYSSPKVIWSLVQVLMHLLVYFSIFLLKVFFL